MFQGWAAASVAALISSLALSGCAGEGCQASNSTDGQVALCNQKNSFAYSTNAGATSRTDSYQWETTHSKASVKWSSNLGMGSVTLTIKDSAGTQVLTKTYSGVGQKSETSTTSSGASGTWTIDIRLNGVSGQVGLTINGA